MKYWVDNSLETWIEDEGIVASYDHSMGNGKAAWEQFSSITPLAASYKTGSHTTSHLAPILEERSICEDNKVLKQLDSKVRLRAMFPR